jgi:hypothetical protein
MLSIRPDRQIRSDYQGRKRQSNGQNQRVSPGSTIKEEYSMWRKNRFYITLALGVALLCLFASALAFAQMNMSGHPKTDAEKIADALRAGPKFITSGATILDWPASPAGTYRVLRKGTNDWTCLPGVPWYTDDEPGCFDPAFMEWIKESLAGKEPHIETVGIAYMYVGAWVPNLDFHLGPHIMIVSPHENQKELQSFSHDGSNGMPYVAHLPNGTDLFLVMPIREWDGK